MKDAFSLSAISLLFAHDAKHFCSATTANTFHCPSSVLHGNLLGVIHRTIRFALHTTRFHRFSKVND